MIDIAPAIKRYWEECTPMKFDAEKWTYPQKRQFRYELQDYMHDAFKFEQWHGKKVLEVGCGSGIDALEFARYGADVTACDITENAVLLTRQLAQEAGMAIRVVRLSSCRLPWTDNTFDCVYSYGVLHHIPEVGAVLEEIKRVLKPGGTFMGMVYHKDSLLNAYSIEYLHRGEMPDNELASFYSERNTNCPYTHPYSKTAATYLMESYFTDVKVSVHYNVLDLPGQRKVKFTIDPKWELGWHLVIKGVKA